MGLFQLTQKLSLLRVWSAKITPEESSGWKKTKEFCVWHFVRVDQQQQQQQTKDGRWSERTLPLIAIPRRTLKKQ